MQPDLAELLAIAKKAASRAASVHRKLTPLSKLNIDTKASSSDLVTEVDREAEQALVTTIRDARPNDSILGEEGTNYEGTSGVRLDS